MKGLYSGRIFSLRQKFIRETRWNIRPDRSRLALTGAKNMIGIR